MMKDKLSVVIITHNAARQLAQVLDKAIQVSDDLVVVDSGSTDQTEVICKNYTLRFVKQDWLGYGKQKNFANGLALHDWILSIDADEVLSDALIVEFESLSLSKDSVYEIPFRNIYCGKEIKFGRWRGERHVRLFNKNIVSWNENAVHEGLNIKGQTINSLQHPIDHYSMMSKDEHVKKAKLYAKIGAERLQAKGKKATFIKLYINPIFRFVMDYFVSFGLLDGKLGFQIAIIVAKEVYWKYRNLKNLS